MSPVYRKDAMSGYRVITKEAFYRAGGFSNSRLVRVTRNGKWAYFERAS